MPLLLIFLTVAASKVTHDRWIRLPMMTVILLCLGIHLSVQGIFSMKFFPNVFGHESDEAYLEKNVRMYLAAKWANRHLTKADRLFTTERQLFYYLNVPYFFGSPNSQIAVDVRISNTDAERLLRQLQALNITHMLLLPLQTRDREPTKYQKPLQVLHELACLRLLHRSLCEGSSVKNIAQLITKRHNSGYSKNRL